MQGRHTEFFGPDLGRGPFSPHKIETAAVQIATALAQPLAPVTRSADDFKSHADTIREIADRLVPDWAAYVSADVGEESGNEVQSTIRVSASGNSLLEMWLADDIGGGFTATTPSSVTFNTGTVLQTILSNRHFKVITPTTGVVVVTVQYTGTHTYRWAISRQSRIYYSTSFSFS